MVASILISTYEGDWEQALQLLLQIRVVYPRITAVLICDGYSNNQIEESCDRLNIALIVGKRLKTIHGHQWTERMLATMAQLPGPVLKIDADMWINRPVVFPSEEWDIASGGDEWLPVIGGCMVLKTDAISKLRNALKHIPAQVYRHHSGKLLYCQDRFIRSAIDFKLIRGAYLPEAGIGFAVAPSRVVEFDCWGPRPFQTFFA